MQLQDVVVAKRLSTDIAAVGLFFGVSPVVDLELLTAAEPLVADAAHVGSLTGVRPHVDDQLTALDERFPADLTLVWSLPSVNPQVAVKFPGVLEAPLTEGARELFSSLSGGHF